MKNLRTGPMVKCLFLIVQFYQFYSCFTNLFTLIILLYIFIYIQIKPPNILFSLFFLSHRNEGQPCSSRLSLPFGFESRCRQKYIKKKLLSLNADGQGTSEDNFFIPSCCVCEITRLNKRK